MGMALVAMPITGASGYAVMGMVTDVRRSIAVIAMVSSPMVAAVAAVAAMAGMGTG